MEPRVRYTTNMAMSTGKLLATRVAAVIEARGATISDALARGLAMWLEAQGEPELAAMLDDGRGTKPRCPLRHKGG